MRRGAWALGVSGRPAGGVRGQLSRGAVLGVRRPAPLPQSSGAQWTGGFRLLHLSVLAVVLFFASGASFPSASLAIGAWSLCGIFSSTPSPLPLFSTPPSRWAFPAGRSAPYPGPAAFFSASPPVALPRQTTGVAGPAWGRGFPEPSLPGRRASLIRSPRCPSVLFATLSVDTCAFAVARFATSGDAPPGQPAERSRVDQVRRFGASLFPPRNVSKRAPEKRAAADPASDPASRPGKTHASSLLPPGTLPPTWGGAGASARATCFL